MVIDLARYKLKILLLGLTWFIFCVTLIPAPTSAYEINFDQRSIVGMNRLDTNPLEHHFYASVASGFADTSILNLTFFRVIGANNVIYGTPEQPIQHGAIRDNPIDKIQDLLAPYRIQAVGKEVKYNENWKLERSEPRLFRAKGIDTFTETYYTSAISVKALVRKIKIKPIFGGKLSVSYVILTKKSHPEIQLPSIPVDQDMEPIKSELKTAFKDQIGREPAEIKLKSLGSNEKRELFVANYTLNKEEKGGNQGNAPNQGIWLIRRYENKLVVLKTIPERPGEAVHTNFSVTNPADLTGNGIANFFRLNSSVETAGSSSLIYWNGNKFYKLDGQSSC